MQTIASVSSENYQMSGGYRTFALCCAFIVLSQFLSAQEASGKGGASGSPPASASGFSVESEMLTYRALESNSEAVACDIGAYLKRGKASFENVPFGAVCTVEGGISAPARIVILPFDGNLTDFSLWRTEMAMLRQLLERAQSYCPANQGIIIQQKGSGSSQAPSTGSAGTTAGALALGLTPAGSLSVLQSALQLVSSETTASPVGGTIQDQSLMDGVARELKSLAIPVVMPNAFNPYSLVPGNALRSPFLSGFTKLLEVRDCLANQQRSSNIDRLLTDLDGYIAEVMGSATASASSPKSSETGGGAQKGVSAGSPPGESTTIAVTAYSPSHLTAILQGDGIALKLGVDPETGLLSDGGVSFHVLLLKALESGGTIERKTNIFGTKIRYSGGSVATYALFTMDGELECSGNVYEFGGSLPPKDFQRGLRNYIPNPSKQYLFQRGTCKSETAP